MAHINRKFIDKHWLTFIFRGGLALIFGWLTLFWGGITNFELLIAFVAMALLVMGIIDSVSAIYASSKKHGWVTALIDAAIDIVAALCILFINDLVTQFIVLAVYTCISGIIDLIHGFVSTVDPTDRFIRIITGICGCVMGFVILNAGNFEITTFVRFFGAYFMIVGVTSLIYGVHNRAQNIEDKIARKETAKTLKKTKKNAKASKKSK